MIYVEQNQTNQVPMVCTRNNLDLTYNTYLFHANHKLTNRSYYFIPFRVIPDVDYTPSYDLFCITVNTAIPQSLTGNTTCGSCNVHLIPGEYYVKVYSQTTNSQNLNPNLSQELVYQTMMTVVGVNQNTPVSYSGDTDVFILYNPYNDES